MPQKIATLFFALVIVGLYLLDWDRKRRTSLALWIPVAWFSIAASRTPAQWLTMTGAANLTAAMTPEQIVDGSPFDRYFLTAIVALSVIVLLSRRGKVRTLLRANLPIVLFFLYCAISIIWSDYHVVALKRWIKAVGDVAMVLIVLSDDNPSAAVKRLLTRVGFLLVPASILLANYYPVWGKAWGEWGGTGFYRGVATSKNELGGVCLLFGVASLWRFCEAFRDRDMLHRLKDLMAESPILGFVVWLLDKHRLRHLIAHGALLAMVVFLFLKANVMTAMSCFVMASGLIVATHLRALAQRPGVVRALAVLMIAVSVAALFFNVGGDLVETIGRDSTLTGRTELWKHVLALSPNALLGTGFENFWLPRRLDELWGLYWWHPNEAHNGYIEVFINLGVVGLVMLGAVIVTSYRKIFAAVRRNPEEGGLWLAYFVIGLVYNFTESAIRIMHPVWIFFLLAIMAAPEVPPSESMSLLAIQESNAFSGPEPQVEHALCIQSRQGDA